MGNQWLSHNDFSQMLGRAGRPSFHDIGKIYLLPELNKEYDNQPEDEMAIELLDSDVDNIHVHYNEDSSIEQVLADICAMPGITSKDINKKYDKMNIPLTSDMILDILFDKKLIREKNKHLVATDYGRAVSVSFLSLFKAEYIRKHLNDNNIRGLVEHVEPFSNAYLTNRLTNKLSKALKTNVSTRLFADSTRDILSSGDNIAKLDPQFIDKIIDMQIEFMACECEEKPFCDCIEMNISDHILNRRLHGYDPLWISREFMSNYEIQIYPGDIYSWLDSIIRVLEAVSRISLAFKNKKVSNEANNLIQKIEKG